MKEVIVNTKFRRNHHVAQLSGHEVLNVVQSLRNFDTVYINVSGKIF